MARPNDDLGDLVPRPTREDREYFSYEKDTSGKIARRVIIANDIIKVDVGTKGTTKNIYNEVNSVAVGVEVIINSFTVPVGSNLDLSAVLCSGDNIARYIVKINGAKVQAKRTWWTDFNAEFNLLEIILLAGDTVEIFVENSGTSTGTFESTITGGEYAE